MPGEAVLALDHQPWAEICAVEVEKIEQEEDERGGVAAVGRQLNDAERCDAAGGLHPEFAVEIGPEGIERRRGLGTVWTAG